MRRIPRKLTANQSKRATLSYIRAMMPEHGGRSIDDLERITPAAPAPRQQRAPSEDTEAPIIKAVSQLLATHPKVLFAMRVNSGSLPYINNKGQAVPVRFHRILTGQDVRVVDFMGWLKDCRPFGIEAKKPSWTKPTDKREFEQAAFLMMIRNLGGVGGFVRSVDEVQALLG